MLRTEFLFLERATAPDEAEQLRCYQQVADLLGPRPLVIRTLDVGGDKPIAYLPLPPEENPALGLRGIRTSLWRPELLDIQLRALLHVRPAVRILLPMITDVAEFEIVARRLEVLSRELGVPRPPLGAMIETPAAAMLSDQIAGVADFLSIGTNDLAQYALAMDRGHAELAARIDGVHPAVLRLIEATTRGASDARQAGGGMRRARFRSASGAIAAGAGRDRALGGAGADSAAQGLDSHAHAGALPRIGASCARPDYRGRGARAGLI